MDSFRNKSVLITGASAGIGAELARQLARAGAHLTLAARRRDRVDSLARELEAAGHATPVVVECDVTRDEDVVRAVAEAVRRFGKLDVAFANAGIGVTGSFRALTIDDYRRQLETNVFGVLRTAYASVPELEKTRGNLVLIASVAGWVSAPGASPYSMSKFAVRALGDAIASELAPAGVTVTIISPGFVASDIRLTNNQGQLRADAVDPVPSWLQMPTDRACRGILKAVARGKHEQIITVHGRVLVWVQRLAPWLNRKFLALGR
jgi:NAD(P)-dependent dehydrogenase (short-subunit alcohol dehydrogenase family)